MKATNRSPTKKRPASPPATKAREKPSLPLSIAAGDDRRQRALLARFRADSSLAPIVDAFESNAREGARKFGSNGLKVNGKLFALFTQGTLVVKLPKERVAVLVAQGTGRPFDPGHGRLMKEWLTVTNPKAPWFELAKEAHDFVKTSKR